MGNDVIQQLVEQQVNDTTMERLRKLLYKYPFMKDVVRRCFTTGVSREMVVRLVNDLYLGVINAHQFKNHLWYDEATIERMYYNKLDYSLSTLNRWKEEIVETLYRYRLYNDGNLTDGEDIAIVVNKVAWLQNNYYLTPLDMNYDWKSFATRFYDYYPYTRLPYLSGVIRETLSQVPDHFLLKLISYLEDVLPFTYPKVQLRVRDTTVLVDEGVVHKYMTWFLSQAYKRLTRHQLVRYYRELELPMYEVKYNNEDVVWEDALVTVLDTIKTQSLDALKTEDYLEEFDRFKALRVHVYEDVSLLLEPNPDDVTRKEALDVVNGYVYTYFQQYNSVYQELL